MTLKRLAFVLLAVACLLCITCKSAPKKNGPEEPDSTTLPKTEEDEGGKGLGEDSSGLENGTGGIDDGSGLEDTGSQQEEENTGDTGLEEGQSEADAAKAAEEAEAALRVAENAKAINKLLKAIEDSRRAAIEAGADDEMPGLFAAADESFKRLRERAESGETSDELRRALENLNALYEGMKEYTEAKEKKKRIDRNGYASHSQMEYDDGAFLLAELEEIMRNPQAFMAKLEEGNSDEGKEFLKKAKEANIDFSTVFKATAMDERTAAFNAKKQADSVKASVSRKSDYDAAVRFFRNGDSKYTNGSIEESIEDYVQAKEIFSKLYLEVGAIRKQSLIQLEEARERVALSRESALQADREKPLSQKIPGIEDADAVLLPADDFSIARNSFVPLNERLVTGGGVL